MVNAFFWSYGWVPTQPVRTCSVNGFRFLDEGRPAQSLPTAGDWAAPLLTGFLVIQRAIITDGGGVDFFMVDIPDSARLGNHLANVAGSNTPSAGGSGTRSRSNWLPRRPLSFGTDLETVARRA